MDRRQLGFLAVTVAFIALAARPSAADDTDLFKAVVPPNVLILMDNSGSMNSIVWHPAFDPSATPSGCSYWDNDTDYFVDSTNDDAPSGEDDTSFGPGTYTRCGNTRTIFVDPSVQTAGGDNDTRWSGRYLNWYFSDAADAYVSEITATANGTYSPCVQDEFGVTTFSRYRRARITAAKDVLREVICNVNQAGEVRFGLAEFRLPGPDNDSNGGYVLVPINDFDAAPYSIEGSPNRTHLQHLSNAISALRSESWTPLGESLFQVYTYFMSRVDNDRPLGVGGVRFPKYVYRPTRAENHGPEADNNSQIPPSPVQYACQKNFVILITDGEPVKDNFDTVRPSSTRHGFSDFMNLIGDYNQDSEQETNPPWQQPGWKSALYLDDIAKFMHERDFRPDLDGDQTLDVYTVGFTTPAHADAVLEKTAAVGGGKFFSSTNPEQLATAIIGAVTDIIEKSQAFTAATVPATRTADGGNLYTSLFVPGDEPYWQGHLKLFTITSTGEIRDKNGNCALVNGQCVSGAISTLAEPWWDAGEEIPAPGSRKLYTSLPGQGRVAFDTNLTAAALGDPDPTATADDLTLADIGGYPGSGATTVEQLADAIIQNLRGCKMGTGVSNSCQARDWLLGDIFHSNPLVVGRPRAFINETSYRAFATSHATRPIVIYAGSNDGWLHGFSAGTWQPAATPPAYDRGTGEELFGFMPWPVRRIAREFPRDGGARDYYGVDGSPAAADVWLYSNPLQTTKAADGSEWRTVLAGGLRHGGRAYYALDVTDPSSASYPGYLWEFPAENASATLHAEIGETWGEPVLTRVKVQIGLNAYERWVAIVSGGYHPSSDPNDALNYDPASTTGRGLYIIDVKTGRVLGEKKFDPSANDGREEMLYAIPGTPSVFDLDQDGFADVIYAGDLGGNVWKWVIKHDPVHGNVLGDPINSTADVSQPDTKFRKWFAAKASANASLGVTVGSTTYYKSIFYSPAGTYSLNRFWLAFGTGERALLTREHDPSVTTENNRFYAVKDLDPFERRDEPIPTITEEDLEDRTSDAKCPNLANVAGYFFRVADNEKFVTDTEIFAYWVIVSSFSFSEAEANASPCDAAGSAALYVFKVFCGQGFFYDPSTYKEGSGDLPGGGPGSSGGVPGSNVEYGDPASRRVLLGPGMPTDPRVTVSPDGTRIVITQQDGEIENLDGEFGGGSAPGQVYWREVTE